MQEEKSEFEKLLDDYKTEHNTLPPVNNLLAKESD